MNGVASYTVDYRVVLDDLDFMGHVNHAKWITICERVRTGLVAEKFTKLLQSGVALVVAEATIKYRSAAEFNDLLTFEISFIEKNPRAFIARHEAKKDGGKTCIEADIVLVCVDSRGKPVALPDSFKEPFSYVR